MTWLFGRRRRTPPAPLSVAPRMCRVRMAELPSIVCQLPRGHSLEHKDERDPDFTFKWWTRSQGEAPTYWVDTSEWWRGEAS